MTEKLMPCPRDAAIHAVALIEMGREGAPYSRDQEEFYSDAAEVVDAVLAAVTPTPAADEVEAVWNALKEQCCSDPVEATKCVMVGKDQLARALQARSAEPVTLPDIGPDPFKGSREEYTLANAEARLRAAFTVQQKGVPDQTALVWRCDLLKLFHELPRLRSIEEDWREKRSAEPAGEEPVGAYAAWRTVFNLAREHGNTRDDMRTAFSLIGGIAEKAMSRPATPPNPERLVEALRLVEQTAETHYTARNGRRCSIEGSDDEVCSIIPFDTMEEVRAALAAAPLKEGQR